MKNKNIYINILTKTKNAQISLFILLGLVIIILFGLIFYASNISTQQETEAGVRRIASGLLESEAIRSFMESCVQDSLDQGLLLIGKQGGFIYKEQQGSIFAGQEVPYSRIIHEDEYFTYLILQPRTLEDPPEYPCSTESPCDFTFNKTEFSDINRFYFGRFGLPPSLEKLTYGATGEQIKLENSLQEQLENYILNNSLECINLTFLRQRPELSEAEITSGNASAEVRFTQNNVEAILDYPIRIMMRGTPPVSYLLEFEARSGVRIKDIHETVKDMIISDNRFLDYNIINHTSQGVYESEIYDIKETLAFNSLKPSASLRKIPYPGIEGTDIIILNDSASRIRGENFIFRFARQNRRPVLEHISDIQLNQNQQHTIFPKALDPDEDILSFSFSGDRNSAAFSFSQDGYYQITVSVSDQSLQDFQTVDIKVCDQNTHSINDICKEECGAYPGCDGWNRNTGHALGTCDLDPHFQDICSSICQKVKGDECYSPGDCKAPANCNGREPFELIPGSGWCYGPKGCNFFCTEDLVDMDSDSQPDICGCRPGADCDSNFNGNFAGTCSYSTPSYCEGDS